MVVDVDTGEVLDNAQGYGYKTKQKAMAAWNYKTMDRSKDAAKKAKEKLIKDWMRHHKGFVDTMGQYCLEIECKRSSTGGETMPASGTRERSSRYHGGPDDKFDTKFVKQMLKDYDLELDGFTAGDLLKVWRKY